MANIKDWIWNEIQQIGKDYESIDEVLVYDKSHSQFRDIEAESREILAKLGVIKGERLLDVGCGTGVLAKTAARFGLSVVAADVSDTMLCYAQKKMGESQLDISFVKGGFLTLEFPKKSFDYIVTSFSFHHLPDFYKFVALKRLHSFLKTNGKLFIQDVVIAQEDYEENINRFIREQESVGGDFLKQDAIQHFREEFSTFDWILEQMFEKAGFTILNKSIKAGLLARYLCAK